MPPSTVAAPGIDILPYVLLPLAGPEEFDLEVRSCLLIARIQATGIVTCHADRIKSFSQPPCNSFRRTRSVRLILSSG